LRPFFGCLSLPLLGELLRPTRGGRGIDALLEQLPLDLLGIARRLRRFLLFGGLLLLFRRVELVTQSPQFLRKRPPLCVIQFALLIEQLLRGPACLLEIARFQRPRKLIDPLVLRLEPLRGFGDALELLARRFALLLERFCRFLEPFGRSCRRFIGTRVAALELLLELVDGLKLLRPHRILGPRIIVGPIIREPFLRALEPFDRLLALLGRRDRGLFGAPAGLARRDDDAGGDRERQQDGPRDPRAVEGDRCRAIHRGRRRGALGFANRE